VKPSLQMQGIIVFGKENPANGFGGGGGVGV